MKKNFKKIVSLLLALVLMLSGMPTIFAQDAEAEDPVILTSGSFEYVIVTPEEGDAYVEIVKYTGDESVVEVPSTIDGISVKVLGHESFYGKTALETVTVKDGIEIIDSRSFCNCTSLSKVELPDSVKEIGDYAFAGCYGKVTVTDKETGAVDVTETGISYMHIPSQLERIGDSAFAGCELFIGNTYIPSNVTGNDDAPALIFPSTLRELGADAFSQCRSMINVIIPEGITDIKTGTFTNCTSLERVEIPSTVTHIGVAFNGAFKGHNRLSEYEPILYIRAPHCIIEDSPDMDLHVVVYGAKHSSVQAYVDKINEERKESYYLNHIGELVGTTPDIDYMGFVEIEVNGHDFIGTVTVPTCTLQGYTTYICQQCEAKGYYADDDLADLYVPHVCDYVDALGHDYSDWIEVSPAGCESSGVQKRICNRVLTNSTGTEVLLDDKGNPCTCDYVSYQQIPPTGHNFVRYDTTTCTEAGQVWKECTYCHAKKDIDARMPYGHVINYDSPTGVIAERVPCVSDGVYLYACNACGYTQKVVVAAHPDVNNDFYCDTCGKKIGSSDKTDDQSCSCSCHTQIGFAAWFYKIKLFFWKLFGTNKVCDCGLMHY